MIIYEEHGVFYRRYSIGEMKSNFVAYIFTRSIIGSLIRCVRRTEQERFFLVVQTLERKAMDTVFLRWYLRVFVRVRGNIFTLKRILSSLLTEIFLLEFLPCANM